jgi:uncharacterized lipoprotein NlpE involved in copper resistance
MKRITVAALIGSGVALVLAQPAAAAETAPVYRVTQEGMTAEEGARLAEAYRIPNALQENGAFGYVGDDFAKVPMLQVATGKDESGRPTASQALDRRALAQLEPIGEAEALERASKLTELIGLTDLELNPKVSHAKLTLSDEAGRPTSEHLLDTTVSHSFTLAGLPVTGQGAKLRITFAPDGTVTQLSSSLRKLEQAGEEPIIPSDQARAACEELYDGGVRQGEPTLGYLLPALGAVETIYPVYTCNPSSEQGEQAHRHVPAVEGVGPRAAIRVSRSGEKVFAEAVGDGSVYKWSSSSTVLSDNEGEQIAYERRPRARTTGAETLTLEVTDRNGLSATASVTLEGDGDASATTTPGGGGFGKLAVGPTDVGIEQTVDEWQCAQDSAIGFKSVMAAHSIPTVFDWRGFAAFEKDFKSQSLGGWDHIYVDNVDAQWYTGHGWSGGFTFKSSVDDTEVTPADARWGDRDLEWMQLESCQVLRDTNGFHDYFGRWGGAVDGLHMLNGFHTNAYCVGGGTGGTFASYLFPRQFLFWTLPALTVRNAWAQMAIDKEPSGVVYRSMGNIGPGWVTNIGDHFWGQGPTGPDISAAGRIGQWSITGTV